MGTSFREEEVNWEELAGIGILRDELELAGELEPLCGVRKREC